jgi:hypothetical protein
VIEIGKNLESFLTTLVLCVTVAVIVWAINRPGGGGK